MMSAAAGQFVVAPNGLARLADLSPAEVAARRRDYWRLAEQAGGDLTGRVVVDQTALNTIHLPAIARLFPDAKVVFAIRDPRDVVFSCFRRKFEPNAFTLEFHSLESAAEVYDRTMQLAELSREKLGAAPIDVRYEDVVADFDGATRRLADSLGLAWSPAMRTFDRGEAALTTASAPQIRRGLNSDSVGAWRPYRDRMAPVLPVLAPWVARFGYPPE